MDGGVPVFVWVWVWAGVGVGVGMGVCACARARIGVCTCADYYVRLSSKINKGYFEVSSFQINPPLFSPKLNHKIPSPGEFDGVENEYTTAAIPGRFYL